MGILSNMFGGGQGGYTSGDGLVHIPNLSPQDALDGFRSVVDFRHIYGPDTKVPNINHGGQIVSGKLPDSALDAGPPQAQKPGLGQLMGRLGGAFASAGQGMQGQQQGPPQLPQQQGMDPFAMLGNFGINPMSNHLGQLGRY